MKLKEVEMLLLEEERATSELNNNVEGAGFGGNYYNHYKGCDRSC